MTDTAALGTRARASRRYESLLAWLSGAQGALVVFVAWLAVGFVLLLVVNRDQWFFGDEWATFNRLRLVLPDDGFLTYLFRPHNEHWSTVPMAVFWLLFETVGLRSYTVWLLPVLAAHLANVALVRVLLRRAGVAPWPATLGAGLLVLFGAGAENLVWAFQLGFVASVTFGLVLVLAADRARPVNRWLVLAWAAGLLSLASSGIGIPMVAAAAAGLALQRAWRTLAWVVAPLALAYLIWYAAADVSPTLDVTTYDRANVLAYAWRGLVAAADGLSGLALAGPVLLLALAAAVALLWPELRDPGVSRVLGLAVAAPVLLLLTGFGRAGLGVEQAAASRYLYLVGFLLWPLAVVVAVRLVRDRPPLRTLALLLLSWAVASNALLFYRSATDRANINIRMRAEALALASLPGLDALDQGVRPQLDYNPDITIGLIAWLRGEGKLPSGPVDARLARTQAALGAVVAEPAGAPTGAGSVQVVATGAADVIPAGSGCVELLPDGSGRAELWLQPSEAPAAVGVTTTADTELGVVLRPVEEGTGDLPGDRAAVVVPAGATRAVVVARDDLLVLDTTQALTVCGLQGT